jgi:hypothetical protein
MGITTAIAAIAKWPAGNSLLGRVPSHEQAPLMPYCEIAELRAGDILNQPGDPLINVYFPYQAWYH